MKGISVIICCYNSTPGLYNTLKHLALQQTDGLLSWEIIIVDNASADDTPAFAKATWHNLQRTGVPFKIVPEKQQGLSFARQRGVEEAKYEYLIFCDDDNWLSNRYIQTAFGCINSDHLVGAIGGEGLPVSDTELPVWFKEYEEAYACGKQGLCSGYINERGYVFGAGMVTRKAVFQNTINSRYPCILSDRKGDALSSGGDFEYCQRLLLQGYNLYYNENLIYEHYIDPSRLTEEYRSALFKGFDESRRIIGEYMEAARIQNSGYFSKVILLTAATKDFLKSFLKRKKASPFSYKLFYYLFNVGYKNRSDLALIKHFYNCRNKKISKG